jgi:hypothetical protein
MSATLRQRAAPAGLSNDESRRRARHLDLGSFSRPVRRSLAFMTGVKVTAALTVWNQGSAIDGMSLESFRSKTKIDVRFPSAARK